VAAGIIVVAAGRDDGREGAAGFPASHPDVLVSEPMLMSTTASTTIAAARTGASSSASPLLAPGIDILTTAPGGGYAFRSGSSLASAHVAATVALIAERERLRSPGDVARRLRASASAASGGIDACRAVVVRPPAAAAEALDADEACR
jgi:subtilisin family serine protease